MTGPLFGEGRRFDAVVPERIGDSRIRIDGIDIAHAVAGFTAHGFNDRRSIIVELHMDITETLRIGAHGADIRISPHSADLLIAAGWVPPEIAALLGPIVETARGLRHGVKGVFTGDLLDAVDNYEKGLTDGE
jgi:hypothetical protein